MTNTKFNNALNRVEQSCPPIWMMRQAGRYQPSYMALKEQWTFEQMCKLPRVAAEVAMLPINEFDFDIAILFSDILWHLEGLGLPMKFDPGPKFDIHLSEDNWEQYADVDKALNHIKFQSTALEATREALPYGKSLIGFVGGPWSLLNYALGANKVSNSFKTMYLTKVIIPLLKDSIRAQKLAGADQVMILDSGLDNISKNYYDKTYLPMLESIAAIGNVGYYMRGTPKNSLPKVMKLAFDGIGIDSSVDLNNTLKKATGYVQGNFNESHLLLNTIEFHYELDKWLDTVSTTTGWVCGLGHGITKTTPTDNVKHFVKTVRRKFE
jgi:uroporphyrinogen decarboxylase